LSIISSIKRPSYCFFYNAPLGFAFDTPGSIANLIWVPLR